MDKKEQILVSALELFANEGYKAVSTSKIAKAATVSEGLIFKHYKSKQGLLEAILEHAYQRMGVLLVPIIVEREPKKVIRKYILLPFEIGTAEYQFWKLLFKLKWEIEYSSVQKMKPLIGKLTWAFAALNYKEPEKEAEVLNHIIESVSGGILKDGLQSQLVLKDFLLNKYNS